MSAQPDGPANQGLVRVLVVDDDVGVVEPLASGLSDFCTVESAASIREAFTLLSKRPMDLIILDLRLPDGNGLDAVREVRNRFREMSILVVTGYGSEDICAQSFRAGATDYLAKPFELRAVRATIARMYSRWPVTIPLGERVSTTAACVAIPAGIDTRVLRALKYLNAHVTERITLRDVARNVGVSEHGLSRLLSTQTGMTFRQWIRHKRLERARKLFRNREKNLSEIASDVGFCDLAHFGKAFRRAEGLSPSAARREVLRGEG